MKSYSRLCSTQAVITELVFENMASFFLSALFIRCMHQIVSKLYAVIRVRSSDRRGARLKTQITEREMHDKGTRATAEVRLLELEGIVYLFRLRVVIQNADLIIIGPSASWLKPRGSINRSPPSSVSIPFGSALCVRPIPMAGRKFA